MTVDFNSTAMKSQAFNRITFFICWVETNIWFFKFFFFPQNGCMKSINHNSKLQTATCCHLRASYCWNWRLSIQKWTEWNLWKTVFKKDWPIKCQCYCHIETSHLYIILSIIVKKKAFLRQFFVSSFLNITVSNFWNGLIIFNICSISLTYFSRMLHFKGFRYGTLD